ncbi:type II toxin-antitoxin system RatA family toxin [Asticcacaulis sp. 201]|uniref:type II toxin-antitoxin system RatA family toxin n=1 Tax=Asticcacaulis sp. 201 TaxID=3028787 RepID=UPI0029167806|nr:SRPBCC family protein [Asticcacaulis sp. 201]MDV6329357.1 SRPBCC family protein [Asticcacaulis sp. 201]
MTKLRLERDLPYQPVQLWEMVGDVERYPEFIPWIKSLRAYNRGQLEDDIMRFDADVAVGFKLLSERFSTRVTRAAAALLVDFDLIRGPFRQLKGRWTFTPSPTGTTVAFDLDIDIKNPLLDAVFKANFNLAVSKLLAIFESRARQLYGAKR